MGHHKIESKWLTDPRLQRAAGALSQTKVSAILCDKNWRLVWASDELKNLFDEWDEEKLGFGKHLVEVYTSDTWGSKVTEESQLRFLVEEFPMLFEDTIGGKDGLVEALCRSADSWEEPPSWTGNVVPDKSAIDAIISALKPVKPPPIYTSYFDFLQGDLPPLQVVETSMRLQDSEGEFFGSVIMYSPGMSAKVLTLLARGDEKMYERMVRLFEPGRRQAAVLFADLQDSTALSRRLPSGAYFRLIRAITTASDGVVAGRKGIVGKHAGDGVTAFFLAEDVGSPSAAARAVIEAARDIVVAARDAAKEVGEDTGLIDPDDCLVNVGIHWGGTLYMGQLVTGGRLEVTALGDEVNEAARIQESARDGNVLASKVLVEHLSDDDARALGLDPDSVLYRPVSELASSTEKAKRDAGSIPVTIL